MQQCEDTWLMKVRKELSRIGLNYIWNLEKVDNDTFNIIKERIRNIFIQECHGIIKRTSKGSLYQHLSNCKTTLKPYHLLI